MVQDQHWEQAHGLGNTHFSLQPCNGLLNLHSNLISKYKDILIGENLNNTRWQKVYIGVNAEMFGRDMSMSTSILVEVWKVSKPRGNVVVNVVVDVVDGLARSCLSGLEPWRCDFGSIVRSNIFK